ncbi:hypothetical protein GCM10010266_38820 [Streptomyces griseomycini]|nr:hypothetical protein GCM10010266_38820 [Streptomyces griseomycini]
MAPIGCREALHDRCGTLRTEPRIRRSLTSTADINDAGRSRASASLSGRRASERWRRGEARIELLKRVSQVRILPGAQKKGQLRRVSSQAGPSSCPGSGHTRATNATQMPHSLTGGYLLTLADHVPNLTRTSEDLIRTR